MELHESSSNMNRKARVSITKEKLDLMRNMRDEGDSIQKIARVMDLSVSIIYKWLARLHEVDIGNMDSMNFFKKPGPKPLHITEKVLKVGECIQNDSTYTQKGIVQAMAMDQVSISQSTISVYLKKLGLTRKRLKKVADKTVSQEVIAKRKNFSLKYRGVSDNNLLYLDETGFNLHTSRKFGYSPKNIPAFTLVPANRGRNISLLAIISSQKIIHQKIVAGSFNTTLFLEFLQECSDLQIFTSSKKVIMDNVKFHKSSAVQNWLSENNIAHDYLPPYSPQLNPIEEVFSTLKSRYHEIKPPAKNSSDIMNNVERIIHEMNGENGVCFICIIGI